MIKEIALGISIEFKETETLGKVTIIDNNFGEFNRRQILK